MPPQDPTNTELAGRIIKLLRSALNNSRIYPAGSSIVQNNINQLYETLKEFLSAADSFTISETNHLMIVEGQDLKSLADNFIVSLMTDNEIQSMKFLKDVSLEELRIFIELLSRRKEQIKSSSGIIELLKSGGVRNVVPSQVKFVAIMEGEEIVSKVSNLVDHLQYDPQAFMTSLRGIYDSLDEIKSDKIKQDMTHLLAKKLTAMEPSQLKDFFDRSLPKKIQESGLQEAVTQALSEEKIKNIFQEITGWYDEIKRNAGSEFEAAEQLSSLRRFIGKILNSPAARNLPFRFYEELLRVGVLEEIPDFVKKEEPTLLLKVDKLLEGESAKLLDPEVRDEIPEIVKHLLQAELEEMVNRLTAKVAENLQQISLKARSDTMQTLLKIFDIVIPFQKEKILLGLEARFLKQVKTETNIDIFRGIANMLRKRMFQLILRGDYQGAIPILGIFKQHIAEGVEPDAEKRRSIEEVFTSFAGEVAPLLINDLKSGVELRQAEAQKVVILFGDTMSGVLLQTMRETDDFRTRRTAAWMLKNVGQNAVRQFFDLIDLRIPTDLMKKLIDVFEEFLPYDYSGKVLELFDYPDVAVKRAAIRRTVKLWQFVPDETKAALKAALLARTKDPDLAREAVHLIAELKITDAAGELSSLLGSAPVSVQEEACIALASIGNADSSFALINTLKTKKKFFGGSSSAPDTVRVRAAWALRYFTGPKTEKALNEALKDKSAPVRSVASQSLEFIRKQPRQ